MEEKEKAAEEVKVTSEIANESLDAVAETTTTETTQQQTPVKEEVVEEKTETSRIEPTGQDDVQEKITEEAPETPKEEVIEEAPSEKKIEKKFEKPTGPDADFDWEKYEQGETATEKSHDDLEKVYDDTLNAIKDHEVIDGTIISISKREVVVNIGFKSDGVIPMSEFRYNPDLKVGDTVEVYIESQEDKKGQLVLSHKQARITRSWDRVNAALDSQEVVKGFVKCRTKGGMIVDVFGIEAFLPGSQIDVKPIRDYDVFVNKTMEFKVIKINQEFKNVVVSHKALIEEEIEQQKKEIISKLDKGQVLEGTVKNITSYGVFIDLGGVDGLIHITDLSWGRVNHPEEVVELDQKLNVVILDFDEDKKRIALGLKQLTPHPWNALDETLKVGDKVEGKVVVMADYGAFVEIAPGVEGLIHVSEMSWSQHLRSAQDFLSVGDGVEAVILTLDRDERKMSLGIKQLKEDPWLKIEERFPLGSQHTAKVRNFTNFGVFVEIEEGVDGLIHISDLSWTKKIKHPSEFTQVGADIEVRVLEIDKDNRRLSLGHKQLEENPWDAFEGLFAVDTIHEGTIVEIVDRGAIVALPYGVEGFVTQKNLVKKDGSHAQTDEKLEFKVIEFNKDAKRINLSHTRTWDEEKRDDAKKAKRTKKAESATNSASVIEKTTLGDIQELADLKDQLVQEATEKLEAKEAKKVKAEKAAKTTTSKTKGETETKQELTEEKATESVDKKVEEEKSEDSVAEEKTAKKTKKTEKTSDEEEKESVKETDEPTSEKSTDKETPTTEETK